VRFGFALVTNGTLLSRPVAEELRTLGLQKARLTLDGPRDIHDRQRPFVSGTGSFDAILDSLKNVWDVVPLQLGGNYSRDTYRRFPELLECLNAEGLTGEKLHLVHFSPIMPKSDGSGMGDHGITCSCTDEPWLVEASIYLREAILRHGFNTPKPKPAGCMVEFVNDVVVGFDGSLYKCPAFMGCESLRVGSLADGVGDYHASHNLDIWKNDECLECSYLPLCFGGCRFLRRLNTGSIDGLDCRRAYYDAVLEQIVRQDLRYRR
jgi:uncharacterized protein